MSPADRYHLADLRAAEDGPAFPVATDPQLGRINAMEAPRGPKSMREIVEHVAGLHSLPVNLMKTGILKRKLAPARQHAMWEMHERGFSNLQIAHFFGLTDHTTVVHGRQRHAARIQAEGVAA